MSHENLKLRNIGILSIIFSFVPINLLLEYLATSLRIYEFYWDYPLKQLELRLQILYTVGSFAQDYWLLINITLIVIAILLILVMSFKPILIERVVSILKRPLDYLYVGFFIINMVFLISIVALSLGEGFMILIFTLPIYLGIIWNISERPFAGKYMAFIGLCFNVLFWLDSLLPSISEPPPQFEFFNYDLIVTFFFFYLLAILINAVSSGIKAGATKATTAE